jgi:parallel beta-helix repeat protein
VLSGDIGVAKDSTDNCLHVVSAQFAKLDTTTVLDGIIVKDGFSGDEIGGAGIYVYHTSGGKFILRNCVIEHNQSFGEGGGLYLYNCHPIVENNIFRNNQAFKGGAIHLYYSNATLRNNQIVDNKANNYPTVRSSALTGGGIYISAYSAPTITNNLIQNNLALYKGGGITISSNSNVLIANNFFIGNNSMDGGGIFADAGPAKFIFNNVLAKNKAVQYGGAIYLDYSSESQLINNTIVANTSGRSGGGLYLRNVNAAITNTVIYSNTAPDGPQVAIINEVANWVPKFRFCTIEKGIQGISNGKDIVYLNNIDVSPLFRNPDGNNFSLLAKSGMIDTGTLDPSIIKSPWQDTDGEVIAFPGMDIAGNPRVHNNFIDIGAFESQAKGTFPPTDITISNSKIDRFVPAGTFVGKLSTVDVDSKSFTYSLLSSTACFLIRNDSLFTNCSFPLDTPSPIGIIIQSVDDLGWSIEKIFEIELQKLITGISNGRKAFYLYPNPTDGVVIIEGDFPKEIKVDIFSLKGDLAYSTVMNNNRSLDISKLPDGVYEIVINHLGQFYRSKLIKK